MQMLYQPKEAKMNKVALTIAGSDSCGGAGIQADIKTMTAHGVYATSAVTALTAQNTLGVTAIMNATPEFLGQELDAIFTDITPDAVKIGMVSTSDLIDVIAQRLTHYQAKNIVVDPVMVATSGSKLIDEDAIATLKTKLIPLARVITPNIPEAEILYGASISTESDMMNAAQALANTYGCAVLVKGGHATQDANDFLFDPKFQGKGEGESTSCDGDENGGGIWIRGKRINTTNTHGTGCTLSSAIASNLAKGFTLQEAITQAKAYLSGALAAGLDLGHGSGPLDHTYALRSEFIAGANLPVADVGSSVASANLPVAGTDLPVANASLPAAGANLPAASTSVPAASAN